MAALKPALLVAALLLAGCASRGPDAAPPPAATPSAQPPAPSAGTAAPTPAQKTAATSLQCEDGTRVAARFVNEAVVLEGLPVGEQRLLRDAGGSSPQHTVWSNPTVRAEFGLGPQGDEAAIHLIDGLTRTLHCKG